MTRSSLALCGFTREERLEIEGKIEAVFRTENYSALVVFGLQNITYASGVIFPFAEQFLEPRVALVIRMDPIRKNVLILPAEWQQLPGQQNWTGQMVTYRPEDGLAPAGLLESLSRTLIEFGSDTQVIGLDFQHVPQAMYDSLQKRLPQFTWTAVDPTWRRLRMIKTEAEVRLLEEAARQADRAIVSALNHSEGCVHDSLSYSLWEFTERVRVHVGEFGGSATGQVTTLQGSDMRLMHALPHGNVIAGEPIRTEVTNHHYGYWSDSTRTFSVGLPPAEFANAYSANITLKQTAAALLKPGSVCQDIFAAVLQAATAAGVSLYAEVGIGHGVGTSEREAPYLCPEDMTVLQAGMVITLSIYTRYAESLLICSKDTYQITDTGSCLLSWYRDWDSSLYHLVGNTARHG